MAEHDWADDVAEGIVDYPPDTRARLARALRAAFANGYNTGRLDTLEELVQMVMQPEGKLPAGKATEPERLRATGRESVAR